MREFVFLLCISFAASYSPSLGGKFVGSVGLRTFASTSACRGRLATVMSALPPGWQELKDPSSQRSYYYNPSTGVTQWDVPVATSPAARDGVKKVDESPIRERRAELMEQVIAKQRLQDEEKARRGPLAMKSNQSAIALALLFIGGPLGTLARLFLTGALPNPFEVCIEGGTNC